MDCETKATNRKELRLYAKLFRSICGFSSNECIDPVTLLDRLPDLEGFEDVRYEIVYGNELPKNVPAQCTLTEDGYMIQIRNVDNVVKAHRITNGTPLENYIYYVDRAREMLGLPNFRDCEPGWGRMAF